MYLHAGSNPVASVICGISSVGSSKRLLISRPVYSILSFGIEMYGRFHGFLATEDYVFYHFCVLSLNQIAAGFSFFGVSKFKTTVRMLSEVVNYFLDPARL